MREGRDRHPVAKVTVGRADHVDRCTLGPAELQAIEASGEHTVVEGVQRGGGLLTVAG